MDRWFPTFNEVWSEFKTMGFVALVWVLPMSVLFTMADMYYNFNHMTYTTITIVIVLIGTALLAHKNNKNNNTRKINNIDDIDLTFEFRNNSSNDQVTIKNNNYDCFIKFQRGDGHYIYSVTLDDFENICEWVNKVKEKYPNLIDHKNYNNQ